MPSGLGRDSSESGVSVVATGRPTGTAAASAPLAGLELAADDGLGARFRVGEDLGRLLFVTATTLEGTVHALLTLVDDRVEVG